MDIDQLGLHQLRYMSLELVDTTFNLWMSATFATLIAIHFVGRQLKTRALVLIATLYSLFSLLCLVRIIMNGSSVIIYSQAIVVEPNSGLDFPFGTVLTILRLLIFAIGSISTLYFVFRSSKEYRE